MTIALSVQGLHRVVTTRRTETSILYGCDLELQGGGLTAVAGHSGSGKSSLLMCLSGLDEPTSGTVTINGRDAYQQFTVKHAKMLRFEVDFVFQQYNLVPLLTVGENTALPFLLDHEPAPYDLAWNLIESFGLSRCNHTPARLFSGGEQQRTALCRVLAHHPSIVFTDEPTDTLDLQSTQIVLGILRRMVDERQMIIMVAHDLNTAAMADRIVITRNGRAVRHLGRRISQELLQSITDLEA